MKIKSIADWFGSNRMQAERPGKLLRGCSCVNVGFAGGMSEIPFFDANIINVNDIHRHVINLGVIVRDRREELVNRLRDTPFHPDQLEES